MKHNIVVFFAIVLVWGLSSCSNLGSVVLPPDRLSYNKSLLTSDAEQTLLNIVRLRYTDPPYFLSVNNVVSQFSFGNDFNVNVANSAPPPSLLGSGSASVNYSESPTITYTPLQGEEYIHRLLTPVNLDVLYMLFRSGWSVHHIGRMVIQRFGEVENASLASRDMSGRIPIFKPFLKLIAVFRHLQNQNNVLIRKDKIDGVFAIRFTINNYELLNTKERAMLAQFNVSKRSPDLWLTTTSSREKNQVYVETRTVLGLLFYLSKGVDVPKKDIINKQARMTYYPDGTVFDWREVTHGMIHVLSSESKPTNASVSVFYRGSWFYIPEGDFSSKETLNLLGIVMGIYQGNIKSTLPVFTVS
ncbi:MAG TPA: hypothetical protein DDY37_02605 [Legionella sp.]|nr:hypothetical protein [Legionella sp.]